MEYELFTPLDEDTVRRLDPGDIVYLNGVLCTARDEAHMRVLEIIENDEKPPFDFESGTVFHCGPIMKKANGEWVLVAAGPTTSSRMNALEPEFIEKTGVRGIIGKGGMSEPTVKAMEKYGCVYLALTGGAAVLAAKGVKRVLGVEWLDLGMPEALWVLETEHFGPLTVAIDAHGNSLYRDIDEKVKKNAIEIRRKLGIG